MFKSFEKFSLVEMNAMLDRFYHYYKSVIGLLGVPEKDVLFQKSVLMEVINRVEKRRVYFKIFYDCKMSEINEIALFCFWIAKLKPFSHTTDAVINDKIAVFYFFHRIDKTAQTPPVKKLVITEYLVKDLSYDLRYRDVSKEALMTLAKALLQNSP
jgi:hypothetical protein